MSKIVFWSPLHGQGQTSNLHVVSFILNNIYKKSVLMTQTHFSLNNLESPIVGKNVEKEKYAHDSQIFQDIGLDAAAMYSQMHNLTPEILESCCITINDTFWLLPGTITKVKETFERDIGKEVIRIIETANKYLDYIIIDANSGDDELSQKIMNIADLIVINLSQKRYVLELFFDTYGDKFIDNEKVFYLFGDYDDNSTYNINNCRRKYKQIKKENSGVIPYCTEFMDANNESYLIKFMEKGLNIKENIKIFNFIKNKGLKNENEYFFHKSKLAVEKIKNILEGKAVERGKK